MADFGIAEIATIVALVAGTAGTAVGTQQSIAANRKAGNAADQAKEQQAKLISDQQAADAKEKSDAAAAAADQARMRQRALAASAAGSTIYSGSQGAPGAAPTFNKTLLG